MAAPLARALVTGAGGVIGAAVVAELLARGMSVVAIDPNQPNVLPAGVSWRRQRLGSLEHEALGEHEGPIHHSFLLAGGAVPEEVGLEPGGSLSRAGLQKTIEDNLVAAMDGIEIARNNWQPLDGSAMGSITIVSSINASAPFGLPAYSASKAALAGLTIALAADLAQMGIRLNCVELGTVLHAGVESLHAGDPQHFERLRQEAPTGRLMTPEEAASSLLSLGLDQPALIGQVIVVDGGETVQRRP